MKALTLHQPWAALVATGTQTVVSMRYETSYRGLLAVHAAKSDYHLRAHDGDPARCHGKALAATCRAGAPQHLVLGAIVGSCNLVECAPIGGPMDFSTGLIEGEVPHMANRTVVVHHDAFGTLFDEDVVIDGPVSGLRSIADQLAYDGLAVGKWAWVLENAEPTERRCPLCWGSGSYPYFTVTPPRKPRP